MKTRIKNLLFLLWVLALPAVAQAQFTYITNADNTLTITGYNGPGGDVTIPISINGLTVTTIGLGGYDGVFTGFSVTSVTIGTNVTSIGDGAFEFCTSLTSVTIGTNVTSIGAYAFDYCTNLTSVTIPDSVTNIGLTPFELCQNLTAITVDANNPAYSSMAGVLFDIGRDTLIEYPSGNTNSSYTIPGSVTNIGDYAFDHCTNLTSVTIPDSVTNIGEDVFGDCTSLTNIAVAASNPDYISFGGVLFDYAKATLLQYPGGLGGSYTIPSTINGLPVTSIGEGAFYQCFSLTSVTIPDSVTSIGEDAFHFCTSLTNATIYSGVIGDSAFEFCTSLTSVTIGTNVTSIGAYAFNYCTNLTSVTIPDSVTSIGDDAFEFCPSLTSVTIPDSVTSIGEWAFYSCSGLTSVTIGNNVTSIGDYAFEFCTSLTSVYFAGNAPTVDSTVFDYDNAMVYYLPGTTGWPTFNANSGLNPAVLWNPQAQTGDGSFGVKNNQFGFNITGSSNLVIVVEASTNLPNPGWTPVSTNALNTFVGTNGTSYFSDPQWTNYPNRYYRFRSP